jgi:tight adherence protein B
VTVFLPIGLGLATLMIVGGVGLVRINRQQKAVSRRLAQIGQRAFQKDERRLPPLRRPERQARGAVAGLAVLFGYDPTRSAQYRQPLIVVILLCTIAARIVVLLASFIIGPWAWGLFPLCIIGGGRMFYAAADSHRRKLLLMHFPDALSLIVRAVRVGVPVVEALQSVGREAAQPTRDEFARLHQELTIGVPLEIALRQMADRNDLPEYGFFAAALTLQAQTGGGLTDTLETLADIIRRRIAMVERGHALSSEARTSTLVLAALPIVTGILLYLTSPGYIMVLFTDPAGKKLLAAAILSLTCGMGIMRHIIRKSLS